MKLHTAAIGKLSAVVLDQHRGVHRFVASSPDDLWKLLRKADRDERGDGAFCLGREEWNSVVAALNVHGAVHVETEFDCDFVITRHLR
ncbi:hypothetical protein ACFPC0_10535 [Streptomyces andamanensis]|uniref:Uncharacterized protein n=1 Tax=Streptomyces andamanensis TaxID=1565035 RepID=A0ABV8TC95_9ACTN